MCSQTTQSRAARVLAILARTLPLRRLAGLPAPAVRVLSPDGLETLWTGTAEYVTPDGYVGVRESETRLDEVEAGRIGFGDE